MSQYTNETLRELMTDVCLVGAGPIGIEMAIALKAGGFDYLHFEAGPLASTIAWYSPGTTIFSSPERLAISGIPFSVYPHSKATREDYLTYLRDVVNQRGLQIQTYSRIISAQKNSPNSFTLLIQSSQHGVGGPEEAVLKHEDFDPTDPRSLRVICKRIILAIGNMHIPNNLQIPGEQLPHVSHFLGEIHQYAGQKVVIVGGKNSAVEAAIRLALAHAQVTICYRREDLDNTRVKPWLLPHLRSLQREGRINFIPSVTPREIFLDRISLLHTSGQESMVACQRVLLLTGYRQRNELFKQLGIELHGNGQAPKHDALSMETNVKGIYVAGTASVGTQISGVKAFIETTHIDVEKILKSLGVNQALPEQANAQPMRSELDWET